MTNEKLQKGQGAIIFISIIHSFFWPDISSISSSAAFFPHPAQSVPSLFPIPASHLQIVRIQQENWPAWNNINDGKPVTASLPFFLIPRSLLSIRRLWTARWRDSSARPVTEPE